MHIRLLTTKQFNKTFCLGNTVHYIAIFFNVWTCLKLGPFSRIYTKLTFVKTFYLSMWNIEYQFYSKWDGIVVFYFKYSRQSSVWYLYIIQCAQCNMYYLIWLIVFLISNLSVRYLWYFSCRPFIMTVKYCYLYIYIYMGYYSSCIWICCL